MSTVQLSHWPCGLVFLLSVLLAVYHSVVQENGVLADFCAQPQHKFNTQFSSLPGCYTVLTCKNE